MDRSMNRLRARADVAACLALLLCQSSMPFSYASEGYEGAGSPVQQAVLAKEDSHPLDDILGYITSAWDDLARSTSASDCKALADPKTDGEPILYLPAGMAIPPELSNLQKQCDVRLEHLAAKITE